MHKLELQRPAAGNLELTQGASLSLGPEMYTSTINFTYQLNKCPGCCLAESLLHTYFACLLCACDIQAIVSLFCGPLRHPLIIK